MRKITRKIINTPLSLGDGINSHRYPAFTNSSTVIM
jgi:hypothetical protein